MALNEEDHRLFTITRKMPMLVVLNTETGAEIARMPAAGECDDVFFNASRKRIYEIGGEGFISTFQQNDPEHYELLANVPTGVGIRTGYFFAKRDRIYVGVPAKGNPLRGDGYFEEDVGLGKTFILSDRFKLKACIELFNVTNSVRFDAHSVSAAIDNPSSFGNATGTLTNPRLAQFYGRFKF
jgi:hypothetical protein